MAAVAPAAVHVADLLQTLSLADPKSEGGKGPETKDKASGGLNGVSKGEVVSLNPPASSAEPWAQQDYMDAAMYYGAYPGAYYCGGWGDYSVYVSQDGGDALFPGLQGQNSPMGLPSAGFMSSMYSGSGMYNTNTYAPSFWYGSHVYGPGLYGGWNAFSNGKYRPRGKTYGSYGFGNENLDGLDELKRGPRSTLFKNQQGSGAAVDVKGEGTPSSDGSNAFKQDQYNLADFGETYSDAKFFIIKSYSEDDVHKSIKYNVWASTPSGNKKLDAAYQEAKEKSSSCPVFLLFSVNTSGQFVGLAEMVGRVDFNKTVDFWQQDKWTGCFPVKWHIVKDVPNSLLKHIILEYNENKPVTNSRDTQEVKLDQGLQVLKIFKDHVCKTSILDDFSFYDDREKRMQEKKSKRQYPVEVMNRKLVATNNAENQATDGKQRLQKPEAIGEQNAVVENGAVAVAANGVTPRELTAMVENGVVGVAVNGVTPEDVKPTTDEAGVANGC